MSEILEKINPDGAIKRGYLKENVRVFTLNSIEQDPIPPHYHEFHKVIFFSAGALDYIIEGKHYHLLPGDILIVPAYSMHQPVINSRAAYRRTVVWINTRAAKSMGLSETFSRAGILGREDESSESEMDSVISEILEYINRNLSEDLSIETLCDKFYLSKSRLITRFKQVTGMPPHQYINKKRIALASSLISSGASANIAATKSGFVDYSSFYRVYKKEFGVSPNQSN